MSEPDCPSLPDLDAARAAPEPVLPGTWNLRRLALLLLLLAHWVAVLAYALPDDAAPAGVPLGRWSRAALDLSLRMPVLDTHPGKPLLSIQDESVLTQYLTMSGQSQRWKMFTPRRRLAAAMSMEYRMEDGSTRLLRVADPERMSRLRWIRWRQVEWNLMNDKGVRTYVPHCALPLAEHLAPGPWKSAALRKRFAEVPVLRERTPGRPRFTSAQDYAERVRDLGRMKTATFPDQVLSNPRRARAGTGAEDGQ